MRSVFTFESLSAEAPNEWVANVLTECPKIGEMRDLDSYRDINEQELGRSRRACRQ